MRIAGKKVVDAKSKIVLEITRADVKNGNTKDPGGCAAALALKRMTHCKKARVHLGRVYIEDGDRWVRFQTPKSLRTEIVAFDRGGAFEPGEYVLSPMQPSHRLGERRGGPDKPKAKRNYRKIARIRHTITGVRHSLAK